MEEDHKDGGMDRPTKYGWINESMDGLIVRHDEDWCMDTSEQADWWINYMLIHRSDKNTYKIMLTSMVATSHPYPHQILLGSHQL